MHLRLIRRTSGKACSHGGNHLCNCYFSILEAKLIFHFQGLGTIEDVPSVISKRSSLNVSSTSSRFDTIGPASLDHTPSRAFGSTGSLPRRRYSEVRQCVHYIHSVPSRNHGLFGKVCSNKFFCLITFLKVYFLNILNIL